MKYPEYLLKLIALLKRFPGVGSKTADRYAFQLLGWPKERIVEFASALLECKEKISYCDECHALMEDKVCHFCKRESDLLCVVATIKDVYAIEATRTYKGKYHVLGGLFSPLEGRFPKPESVRRLKTRTQNMKEIIIALDATLEGDATALYLKKELGEKITLTRLALGIPMGSSLDFIDEGTLARALSGRGHY